MSKNVISNITKNVVAITEINSRDKTRGDKTMHKTLKNVIILAQVLGQFPVMGVTSPSENKLYFSWKTWKAWYCSVLCLVSSVMMGTMFYNTITNGANIFNISGFLLQCCKVLTTFAFIYIAKRWPNLMKEWKKVDVHMRSYGWIKRYELRINIITSTSVLIALGQLILEIVLNIQFALKCTESTKAAVKFYYTILTFPYIFSSISYSFWLAIFFQYVSIFNDIVWCYVDLFIMVMSSGLAMRFQQVTKRMQMLVTLKNSTELNWKHIREDYNRLCKLCKLLDDTISYLVLLSFGSNLFFILIQLFNGLSEISKGLDKFYYFYTFGFLIARTIYVSLYAAWINDESKRPIYILNSVTSEVYNVEVKRFIQQIGFDAVALTGRNFFNVTRGLILSVAGAIVTYELVLIQFNAHMLKDKPFGNSTLCPWDK